MAKPNRSVTPSKGTPNWVARIFKAERQKVSIVSVASLVIGLILYANEAVTYKSLKIQSSKPFNYVQTLKVRGTDYRYTRQSYDDNRLTFSNTFESGVLIDDIRFTIFVTKSGYAPDADCSMSDAVEKKIDPEYFIYPVHLTASEGMTVVPGGFMIPGTNAVAGISIKVEGGTAGPEMVAYEDQKRGIEPRKTYRIIEDPFVQIIEKFSKPEYKNGTAWGCLTVDLQPVGSAPRTVSRLIGIFEQPLHATGTNIEFLADDAKNETKSYALFGPYIDRGVEFYRVRHFDLLGPLKNLR